MSKKTGNYEVGYGKPPKHSQFQPGQSGNRRGRPKGASNKITSNSLYALIDREASRMVSVMNGDQKLTMTMANLVIKTLIKLAAQGNTRAMGMFFEHLKVIEEKGLAEEAKLAKQQAADFEALLESMTDEQLITFEELMAQLAKTTPSSPSPQRRGRRKGQISSH